MPFQCPTTKSVTFYRILWQLGDEACQVTERKRKEKEKDTVGDDEDRVNRIISCSKPTTCVLLFPKFFSKENQLQLVVVVLVVTLIQHR